MPDQKPLPGKFTWFELISTDIKKAQGFYGEVLGWKVQGFPMGASTYEMIFAGETMIGGYAAPKSGRPNHWLSYVSVENVDTSVKTALENGGKVVDAAFDIPGVGRVATIADPAGAVIALMKNSSGDPPDENATQGRFFWNELHTSSPTSVLPFYEKVVGFVHSAKDMGPGGTYYLVGKGGVDRGGVTHHLDAGVPPHWLPYVCVDDPDETIARAKRLGAKTPVTGMDIPGIGRFGVLQDPTGGVLAVMRPVQPEKPRF